MPASSQNIEQDNPLKSNSLGITTLSLELAEMAKLVLISMVISVTLLTTLDVLVIVISDVVSYLAYTLKSIPEFSLSTRKLEPVLDTIVKEANVPTSSGFLMFPTSILILLAVEATILLI